MNDTEEKKKMYTWISIGKLTWSKGLPLSEYFCLTKYSTPTALTGQILGNQFTKIYINREQRTTGMSRNIEIVVNIYYYRDPDVYIHVILPMHSPVQCKFEMLHKGW